MPPRRSTGSTSKRPHSPSTSLSPPPEHPAPNPKPTQSPRKARPSAVKAPAVKADQPHQIEDDEAVSAPAKTPRKKPRKSEIISTAKPDEEVDGNASDSQPAVKKKVPKSKHWPPLDLDPALHPSRSGYPPFALPKLTVPRNGGIGLDTMGVRPMLLGAHVSIGGGMGTALLRAGLAGANGLAMFVKSQRQWKSNPYENEVVERFRDLTKAKEDGGLGYSAESILVHGSYLINLGNPDTAKWDISYQCFKDDLYRCHQLGVKLYNWHPGSTVGACTKEESYASIAKAINRVHKEVPEVICVIENMANANSNIIGTTFHDLASIIALVDDKSRVRICLDTCHLFAAGYDIRTPLAYAETMRKFDVEVGNGYLAGIHMNDSKADLGACKDLHENIGLGKIGLSAFRQIMRDPLMAGIPLVLETPANEKALEAGELSLWTREIKLLYQIQSIPDDEWEIQEERIREEWRVERDRLNPPKPPKEKKEVGKDKAKAKAKAKKGNKAKEESEISDEEEAE